MLYGPASQALTTRAGPEGIGIGSEKEARALREEKVALRNEELALREEDIS